MSLTAPRMTGSTRGALAYSAGHADRASGTSGDAVSFADLARGERLRCHGLDPELSAKEAVPEALSEANALLCHAAYGSDLSAGDPVVIKGIGKTKPRTPTSEAEGVGGAARPQSKRPGASHRNVIKVRKAYETKIKLDPPPAAYGAGDSGPPRRRRRSRRDDQRLLPGVDASARTPGAYCPACGHPMATESA